MKRFPEGRMAVLIASQTQDDRVDIVKPQWKIVSSDPNLEAALSRVLPLVDAAELEQKSAASRPIIMPGNGEKRARETRKMLASAWKRHVKDTEFEDSKQMYKIVALHPEMKFDWWDSVTGGVQFRNTAVDDPVVSEKVFRYLAGLLRC